MSSAFEGGFGEKSTDDAVAVGDVVTLKSGGPQMTVSEVDGDSALCAWFVDSALQEQRFKLAVIRPISITDDPSKIFDKMSEAARGVFEEFKERAKGFKR